MNILFAAGILLTKKDKQRNLFKRLINEKPERNHHFFLAYLFKEGDIQAVQKFTKPAFVNF